MVSRSPRTCAVPRRSACAACRRWRGSSTKRVTEVQRLLDTLSAAGVDFVVVGGVVLVLRGSSRVTLDLDLCYSRDRDNLRRLAAALAPHHPRLRGAPPDLPFLWDDRTLASGLNFTLTTDLGDLDILGETTGVGGYAQVSAGSSELSVGAARIRVMDLYVAATWLQELVEVRAGGLIPIARQYPGAREFVESTQREFPGTAPPAAAYGACQVLVEAIRRAGSLDRGKIRDAISKMDYNTVFGRFRVDRDGVQIGHKMVLFQWQDGKRAIVWPEELAPSQARFPTPPRSQRP